MFCINCFHPTTAVTNSRPHKKQPFVWRRRQCQECKTIFTTYERPSLADNRPIHLPDGKVDQFNLGKLILSIAGSFSHAPLEAQYNALWLAQSVEDSLSSQRQVIAPEDIAAVTHQLLKRYDMVAAIQYGAKHHLISSVRKLGKPSLHEHGLPTDGSLSQ